MYYNIMKEKIRRHNKFAVKYHKQQNSSKYKFKKYKVHLNKICKFLKGTPSWG